MQDKMEEKIMIAPSIMCISEWHDTKNIFRQLKVNGIAMIHRTTKTELFRCSKN